MYNVNNIIHIFYKMTYYLQLIYIFEILINVPNETKILN